MSRPPLFAELCAGLASMSLMLQHGKHCKPPVSRMGNKHGYALAILRVMGLRPGQRAEQYLWCEPDPGCRALLTAYTDPALMREAAEIVRGWKDEDPRALWERLRAEGPIRDFGAREVGRWTWLWGRSYNTKGPDAGFLPSESANGVEVWNAHPPGYYADRCTDIAEASELARYLQVTASNRLVNIDSTTMQNSGKGGTTFGGEEFATGAEKVADAAREVARFGWIQSQNMRRRPLVGRNGELWTIANTAEAAGGMFQRPQRRECHDGGEFAERVGCTYCGGLGWAESESYACPNCGGREAPLATIGLPATIVPDAREIHPPTLPPGCVAYLDPPYVNTTGYGNDLPREDVCELAERWASAGAAVYISEAEPLTELDGWHTVEITQCRKGQRRTFGGTREFLTCSVEPAWRPAVQQGLFGSLAVDTGRR